jgi:uncharacterized tellurite resistance protein B-like protein
MSGPTQEQRAFVEAGIGILMATIMADGKFSRDEFTWWKTAQVRHPLFRDVPAEDFNPMLHSVKTQLGAAPWRDLVSEWARAVPEQYRLGIYELACELSVVDKELEGQEPDVVMHLRDALGIPLEQARSIFMSKIERM